jgi:hypothetical protein
MRSSPLSVAIFISPRNQDISCCIGKHNHGNESGRPHPERLPVFFPSLPASPVLFPVLKDQIDSNGDSQRTSFLEWKIVL